MHECVTLLSAPDWYIRGVLRVALVVLAVVVVGLLVISRLPQRQRAVPDANIALSDARVMLYPQADPEAVWTFAAPTVTYDPDASETTLLRISDGRREVRDVTDFTLTSDRIVIDANDDIRGGRIEAHLVDEDVDLDMQRRGTREVLIDQSSGQFQVPRVTITDSSGTHSVFEDMRISFDFTTFESGGPGTVGYGQFAIDGSDAAPGDPPTEDPPGAPR